LTELNVINEQHKKPKQPQYETCNISAISYKLKAFQPGLVL